MSLTYIKTLIQESVLSRCEIFSPNNLYPKLQLFDVCVLNQAYLKSKYTPSH